MKKVLVEKQAAALLDVSIKCMQGWRYKGGGPPYAKMGRLIRYLESDLEAFVLEKRRTSTSDSGRSTEFHFPPGIRIIPRVRTGRGLEPGPATVSTPAPPPRPAPGSPTRRRHSLPRGRVRIRVVFTKQQVTESAPRPAR